MIFGWVAADTPSLLSVQEFIVNTLVQLEINEDRIYETPEYSWGDHIKALRNVKPKNWQSPREVCR